jgi:tRNA uridine 5-carboxymethylaminomethyl modification enzyme
MGLNLLESQFFTPKEIAMTGIVINQDGQRRTGMEVLAFADVTLEQMDMLVPEFIHVAPIAREQLAIEAMYKTYIDRQARDAKVLQRDEGMIIPASMEYGAIGGLSNELKGKLERVRPHTLAQAGRIDGMTPAALALILTRIRQEERRRA